MSKSAHLEWIELNGPPKNRPHTGRTRLIRVVLSYERPKTKQNKKISNPADYPMALFPIFLSTNDS